MLQKNQNEDYVPMGNFNADAKNITRQMLLNCHVYRKRNSNVSPLTADKTKPGARSPRATKKYHPAQILES